MKHTWLVLVLASMAFGQLGGKLEADLMVLKGSQQFADDILSIAEAGAQPSRRVVVDFTDELTRALIGKPLPKDAVSRLSAAIIDVVHSDGVPTSKYRASLDSARLTLVAMKVSRDEAQRVADKLRILGQQIRGPEDLPLNIVPVLVK